MTAFQYYRNWKIDTSQATGSQQWNHGVLSTSQSQPLKCLLLCLPSTVHWQEAVTSVSMKTSARLTEEHSTCWNNRSIAVVKVSFQLLVINLHLSMQRHIEIVTLLLTNYLKYECSLPGKEETGHLLQELTPQAGVMRWSLYYWLS